MARIHMRAKAWRSVSALRASTFARTSEKKRATSLIRSLLPIHRRGRDERTAGSTHVRHHIQCRDKRRERSVGLRVGGLQVAHVLDPDTCVIEGVVRHVVAATQATYVDITPQVAHD